MGEGKLSKLEVKNSLMIFEGGTSHSRYEGSTAHLFQCSSCVTIVCTFNPP